MVIKLAGGLGELRSFEIAYQDETESITFSNDKREEAREQLIAYLKEKNLSEEKVLIVFNYDGKNAWARDVSIVQNAIQNIKKETPLFYLENNVSDFQ